MYISTYANSCQSFRRFTVCLGMMQLSGTIDETVTIYSMIDTMIDHLSIDNERTMFVH